MPNYIYIDGEWYLESELRPETIITKALLIKDLWSKKGRWFFDTELLVRAQRKGLKIAEIPIEWKEASNSKFRLLGDAFQMARSLASFKLKHG